MQAQELQQHRKILLTRWAALSSVDPWAATARRPALDAAVEEIAAEEQYAREASRRLGAGTTTGTAGGAARMLPQDVYDFLQHTTAETAASRLFRLFANQCRWLPLSHSQELRRDMHTYGYVSHHTLIGGITDAVRMHATLRSSCSSLRSDTHQHDVGGAVVLSAATVTDLDLVRDTLPPLTADLSANYAWLLVMTVAFGLDPPKQGGGHEEMELFYRIKRIFRDVFARQARQQRGRRVYPANPEEEAATLAAYDMEASATHTQAATATNGGGERRGDVVYLKKGRCAHALVPALDHVQEKQTARLLRLRRCPDELLKSEAEFVRRDDVEYAELHLKQRLAHLVAEAHRRARARHHHHPHHHRHRGQHKALAVSSFQEGELFAGAVWNTMYRSQSGHSASSSHQRLQLEQHTDASASSAIPTCPVSALQRSVLGGGGSTHSLAAHGARGSEAEGGGDGEGDHGDGGGDGDEDGGMRPEGRGTNEGVLAFLLLRHMHTRALREEALSILNYVASVGRTLSFLTGEVQQLDTARDPMGAVYGSTQRREPQT